MKLREFLSKLEGFDPETELFQISLLGDKLEKISDDLEVINVLVSKNTGSELFVISESVTEHTMKGILLR